MEATKEMKFGTKVA